MKTILTISIILMPLLMWSQTKTLTGSAGDQIESGITINGSWGQVFTNQVNQQYSFSEGFQQYEGLVGRTINNARIAIQPNPTSGQVQITSSEKILSIKIFDNTGFLVQSKSVENEYAKLDLGNLPSGIYFVHTFSEDNTSNVQKIIKL